MCALLHDIGDTLGPYNHPDIAAAHPQAVRVRGEPLDGRSSTAIFQGYYFFHHIGLDRNARERYRDSPYCECTEEFCAKYDQTAFDPDYDSSRSSTSSR